MLAAFVFPDGPESADAGGLSAHSHHPRRPDGPEPQLSGPAAGKAPAHPGLLADLPDPFAPGAAPGTAVPADPGGSPVRLPFLCTERRKSPLAADSRHFLPAGGLPGGLCIRSGLPYAGPGRPVRPDGPSQQLPAAVPGLCLRRIAAFDPAGGRDGPSLSTFPPGAGAAGGLPSRFHRRLRHPAHAGRSGGEKGDRIKMSRSGEHSGTFFSLTHSKNGA